MHHTADRSKRRLDIAVQTKGGGSFTPLFDGAGILAPAMGAHDRELAQRMGAAMKVLHTSLWIALAALVAGCGGGTYSSSTGTSMTDTTAPVIRAVSVSVTSTSATISWATNEGADSQVEYGLTNSYGSSSAASTTLVTSHNQTLTGLIPGTTYHYRVKSQDAAGNLAVSEDSGFVTAAVTGGGAVLSGNWVDVTANLASLWTDCGALSALAAKPDEDMLVAGVSRQGVYASTDGGNSWYALGTGSGSTPISGSPESLVFDLQNSGTFWVTSIHGDRGVYKTTNKGLNFSALPGTGGTAGYDTLGVDWNDPARKTLVLGGHETGQLVQRSVDGGLSWTNVGATLSTGLASSNVVMLNANTFLVGASNNSDSTISRTTDGGQTWQIVSPAPQGGGIRAPLHASNGSIYWLLYDGLMRSDNQGQTWTQVTPSGVLKNNAAFDGIPPIELPDGRIAALSADNKIVVSSDRGSHWNAATTALPYSSLFNVRLTYSVQRKAFFVSNGGAGGGVSCSGGPLPKQAVMRYDFDATTATRTAAHEAGRWIREHRSSAPGPKTNQEEQRTMLSKHAWSTRPSATDG